MTALTMRSSSSSAHHPTNPHSYMPSVPLSVYRELALELQATQETIDALKSQNQQLARHNQHLRQEIEKVVQHVSYLQQVVDTTVANQIEIDRPEREYQVKPKRSPSGRVGHQGSVVTKTSNGHPPEVVAVEEVEVENYHHRSQPDATRMNGWGMAIAVSIVVVTAFSTGFLMVRPLASHR